MIQPPRSNRIARGGDPFLACGIPYRAVRHDERRLRRHAHFQRPGRSRGNLDQGKREDFADAKVPTKRGAIGKHGRQNRLGIDAQARATGSYVTAFCPRKLEDRVGSQCGIESLGRTNAELCARVVPRSQRAGDEIRGPTCELPRAITEGKVDHELLAQADTLGDRVHRQVGQADLSSGCEYCEVLGPRLQLTGPLRNTRTAALGELPPREPREHDGPGEQHQPSDVAPGEAEIHQRMAASRAFLCITIASSVRPRRSSRRPISLKLRGLPGASAAARSRNCNAEASTPWAWRASTRK